MTTEVPYVASDAPRLIPVHPRYHLALRTRTRLLGTLNLAVALGGRSTGWGYPGKPRRTFVGRHRASLDGCAPYHRAVELVICPHMGPERRLFRVRLGSGIVPLRRLPGVANSTSVKGQANA